MSNNTPSTLTCIREVRAVYKSKKSVPAALNSNPTLRGPEQVAELVRRLLPDNTQEHFFVLNLNSAHQIESYTIATTGLLNSSQVHPREVFKTALLSNSVAIICGHNHPSGNCEPSKEDLEIHKRLVEAGKLLGVNVLDDMIVTDSAFYSLN